jgi:hypothetical protein
MEKMEKKLGMICIVVCVACVLWAMITMAYTVPSAASQYRFDGVYAAEGTSLMVKNGELVLIGGSNFSVDRPLRRIVDLCLSGLCFLTTLGCGIFLLLREKQAAKNVIRIDG